MKKIEEHSLFMRKKLERKRSLEKAEAELVEAIKEKVANSIIEKLRREGKLEDFLQKILQKKVDPASIAEKLVNKKCRKQV